MSIKFNWRNTGIGAADNLGRQYAKVIRGVRQGSIETKWRYARAGERFIRFVGEEFKLKKIQNMQDKHVRAYVEHLQQQGRADKYIKTELSAIRYVHRQIPQAKHELADAASFNKEVGLGSTPDGRADRAWTDVEVSAMKQIALELDRPEVARVIEVARSTGMRLDEASSLRRHEVEQALRTGALEISNTKGGRPRSVPLSHRAEICLQRAIEDVPRGGYVFTPEGIKVHQFEDRVKDFIYNHRDKIQDADRTSSGHNVAPGERGALTAHGLRHAYARSRYEELVTELKENLSDERAEKTAREQVAEELGHGRDTVTFIYTL